MSSEQFPNGQQWTAYPPYVHPLQPPTLRPGLVLLVQRTYDAQSSRRNMSIPVQFIDQREHVVGIRLSDALDPNLNEFLQDPTAEVLNENVGQKLSYRLQFDGYDSFSKQKYSRTTGRDVRITRAKMAKQVAEIVQAFIEERGPIGPNSPTGLVFGEQGVRLDDVYLTEVQHVTTGSLQPTLYHIPAIQPQPQMQAFYPALNQLPYQNMLGPGPFGH